MGEVVERVSNDRLTFLMQHGAGKSSDVPPLCLDLRDCRARLSEAQRERDEARAMEQASKMAHSFQTMKWACGHECGAVCYECFHAACVARDDMQRERERYGMSLTDRRDDPLCLDLRDCRARLEQAERERDEMQLTLDIIHAADMRAIKRWQEQAPETRSLVHPDRADLVVWLSHEMQAVMGAAEHHAKRADAAEAQVAALVAALETAAPFLPEGTMCAAEVDAALSDTSAAAQAHDQRMRREERERCARVAEDKYIWTGRDAAAAIRALGETE